MQPDSPSPGFATAVEYACGAILWQRELSLMVMASFLLVLLKSKHDFGAFRKHQEGTASYHPFPLARRCCESRDYSDVFQYADCDDNVGSILKALL
ncbi:hypothetical protein AVEN_221320-1 [Araneus ventricosus]|uniref:Uncharacterized protein n=1 Tax=Araneus ventricosus TaxID=182803 RepID=A0A4Y2B1E0_ARAVE|nr:hypothetical protein AVEN_221320-1 [Araneus ventricosus]